MARIKGATMTHKRRKKMLKLAKGFERLLLFVTGMGNIRDVIPFPRTPKNADF